MSTRTDCASCDGTGIIDTPEQDFTTDEGEHVHTYRRIETCLDCAGLGFTIEGTP